MWLFDKIDDIKSEIAYRKESRYLEELDKNMAIVH